MECAFHPGAPAAGQCTVCRKFLCACCVNRFQPPMCQSCLTAHNRSVELGIYLKLIVSAAAFMAIALLISSQVRERPEIKYSPGFIVFISYYIVSLFWGMKFVDRWRYNGPTTVNLFYLGGLLRFFLGALIGPLVTPVALGQMVLELRSIRRTKAALKPGEARES